MKKLISMTDFVLEKNKAEEVSRESFVECSKYANFLKQPLELWMFVPCDEDGNVLKSPICNSKCDDCDCMYEFNLYQQAQERCLFDGFKLGGQTDLSWRFIYKNIFPYFVNKNGIVEDIIKYNIQPTPTALKQIGL